MNENKMLEMIEQVIDDRLRLRNRELLAEVEELLYTIARKADIRELKEKIEKSLES